MAKNINHVSHKKSKQKVNGMPQLPSADAIVEGEIAVNFGKGVETLSIKNESGDVVTFSSDHFYTEQKLGSAFTGANSGNTVTSVIESNERVTASALNDLQANKLDASAYTPIHIDQTIDSTTSASTDAVSTSAVYGFVTSYTPSITVDQVLDDTTSASTNPVSSKAVYSALTADELVWTNAYVAMSGAVSAHTENTDIHLTAAEKTNLDSITGAVGTMAYENKGSYSSATQVNTALGNKANTSDLDDFFDDAKYEDSGTTKVINFYHGNTIKATIDASDFIVDGMVDDVRIENGYLVIDFNTESGKQDISIPLTDIFDPSNYYDKDDIDDLVGSGFTSSSITDVIIENEEIVSAALTDLDERKLDASAYTPSVELWVSGTGENAVAQKGGENTASGSYSVAEGQGTTASNDSEHASGQYNVSNSATTTFGDSGNTLFSVGNGTSEDVRRNAFEIRQNGDIYIVSGNTGIKLQDHIGSVETVTAITPSNSGSTDPIATKVVAENERVTANALTDLDERKLDASAYTPTDLSNYYTKSETSGATEISNALQGKSNANHNQAANTITAMTGYAIASASGAVATNDTLNAAVGKLEKRIALLEAALGGMKLVKLTQAQYDALTTKDSNTLYVISD